MGATSVGSYALFAGGESTSIQGSQELSIIDIFNSQTRNWTKAFLSSTRKEVVATSAGKYALFAFGESDLFDSTDVVDIWDSEGNIWIQSALSQSRVRASATSVGRYALFAGGIIYANYTSRVDVFNSDDSTWNTTELSEPKCDSLATSVGPYALFAAGQTRGKLSSVVDLFHSETLQMTTMQFPLPRPSMGVTSVGPLAMFAGGRNSSGLATDRVDIWNYITNEWTVDKLATTKQLLSATSNGKFAFFGMGSEATDSVLAYIVDIYNYESKEWITADLTQSQTRTIGASVGQFVLFAGGYIYGTKPSTTSSRVNIWQVCNSSSDCIDDGAFCTDSVCINGLCNFYLDHCRNNAECNKTGNEQAKNCFAPQGSTCGDNWCEGKLCDNIGYCSYSKPRCTYDNSTSTSCQSCDSVRESCFRPEGDDCLVTGAIAGKCDDIGKCKEPIVKEKSNKTGLIVGVVVGVVALLCIVIGAIAWIFRRRFKSRDNSNINQIELMSALSGITIEFKLGGGNFGEVFKGTWNGTTAVALKKLKDQSQLREFEQEATMLQSLQHPNIVRYLGIYKATDGVLYIVTEYISDGSLLTVIHQHMKELDNSNLTSFAAQAASGMAYLESKGIIHRDLSLRNLLASKRDSNQQKYQVYVSDFGLSRMAEEGYYRSSEKQIPVKWSAPEAIEYGFFTSKSDVWSFGVLLWELFSGGKQPYPGVSNSELLDKLNSGYRLPQPTGCPSEVYQLMQDCWKQKAEERPTFQEAFAVLSKGYETFSGSSYQVDTSFDNDIYMSK